MNNKKLYVTITGIENSDWQEKLAEIKEFKITEAAVFLTRFDKKERDHLYKFLLKSNLKYIPLVHLRHDTDASDIEFFNKNFGTNHFNIHENAFQDLDRWGNNLNKLYLELNYDGEIPKVVDLDKIGGFCLDLSHFKSAIARGKEEATLVFKEKSKSKFACNHLNGYNDLFQRDVHFVTDLRQFDYLKDLPEFVFGKIIAIEVDNCIEDQLNFKEYILDNNLISN